MCGINGIVSGASGVAPAMREQVVAMNRALSHRGPDDEGEFVDDGIALGHRRLSIIDLSDAGRQPMFNEDGSLVLVFNGEIYNYIELIAELQALGHIFRSRSDSEVILHAYEQWGDGCVQRFNGMWAFALWDRKARRLVLSRDRLGVKPLLYAERNGQLLFSSELAGLRAVTPLRHANLTKLYSYLAYGYRTNDGQTMCQGVHELPPGHNAVYQAGRLSLRRYWTLPEEVEVPPRAERVERLRELLSDAVRLRFRSDVPVALLQSGGVDSSILCTIVNDAIAAGRLGQTEVASYTAVHPGHAYDESAAVRTLMESCPYVRAVELQPNSSALAERLPDFVRRMQEPMASPTSYAHEALMQGIKANGIKVVINGQGADEAFAGYGTYIVGYRLLDLLLGRPSALPGEAAAMHRQMGYSWSHLVAQTAKAVMGRHAASSWRANHVEGGARVLTSEFTRSHGMADPNVSATVRPRNLDRHLRSQLLNYGLSQILHYEDQSSMSHSVEIRSPFVDYRVVEFAFSLPMEERFSGGVTKHILRRAYGDRLPRSIVNNHRKIGFATPFDQWAATPTFRSFVEDLVASRSFRERRIWNADRLAQRLLDPRAVARGFPVWRFVNAELWMREFGVVNA